MIDKIIGSHLKKRNEPVNKYKKFNKIANIHFTPTPTAPSQTVKGNLSIGCSIRFSRAIYLYISKSCIC